MFESIFAATYEAIVGDAQFAEAAFLSTMPTRVSKHGLSMRATSPQLKRLVSRSSSPEISHGARRNSAPPACRADAAY